MHDLEAGPHAALPSSSLAQRDTVVVSGAAEGVLASTAGRELCLLCAWGDSHDVPREPEPLETVDQPPARVQLPAGEAVVYGGREGVVVVVPRLAEGR
jgi:hypothetical protein